jgi:hypothetical protein
MEKFLMGLSNNYLIYVIVSVVIIIAIVGFIVDSKKAKIDKNLKEAPIQENKEEKK